MACVGRRWPVLVVMCPRWFMLAWIGIVVAIGVIDVVVDVVVGRQ
jgi:hypothetical protein